MRKMLYLALLVVPFFAMSAVPAAALTTNHVGSDAAMLAMLTDTIFVAEGRIGDGSGSATFELDLGKSTAQPEVSAQYNWPNGQAVPFTLSYAPMTSQAVFTMGQSTLNWTSSLTGFSDLFVRTRAVDADSRVLVTDMVLDGVAVNDLSYAIGQNGLDILWIQDANLIDGFTMTGHVTMTWTGARPSQSRLAFQIKVVEVQPTAVDATTWSRIKSLYY